VDQTHHFIEVRAEHLGVQVHHLGKVGVIVAV
jgi:hypothetical protein